MNNAPVNIAYDYADITNRLRRLSEGEEVDFGEEEIAFALDEAKKRGDGDVILMIAEEWYLIRNDDETAYAALLPSAAEGGSVRANYRLAQEYRLGKNLPRDYEKAYVCYDAYIKNGRGDLDECPPIDPEDFMDIESNDGEITAGDLEAKGDWEWWMFVLRKHPTRALKCGIADWYMEKGEVEEALGLCTESGEEGFPYATRLMLEYYLPHQLRVPIFGKWSQNGVANVEKAKYWYRKAEQAGEDVKEYAGQLGLESEYVQQLVLRTKPGCEKPGCDKKASAELALAFLNGNGCPRDLDRAFSFAEDLLFEEEDYGVFSELLEAAIKDPEVKRRYNLLVQKANDVEKSV